MKFHAVGANPSTIRAVALSFSLILCLAQASGLAQAGTLGVINSVNRAAGEITISGLVYKTGSTTEVKRSNAEGADEIAALYALQPGQHVVFEAQGKRVVSIRLQDPGSIDLPSGSLLAPARIAPAER